MTTVTIGNLLILPTVSDGTVFAAESVAGLTRKVTASALKTYMSTTTTMDVSGAINAGGGLVASTVEAGIIGNTGAILTGTLSTNAQPNINSLGSLTGLTVTGNVVFTSNLNLFGSLTSNSTGSFAAINNTIIGNAVPQTGRFTTVTATTVNAGTIGNTGATLTGTLSTAAQPNIASLGTLSLLNVTGNIAAGNVSATRGTFTSVTASTGTFTTVTGTLGTAAQPNVTSLGTLSSVAVTGVGSFGNITTTNGVFWANGVSYTSGTALDLSSVGQNIVPSANLTYNLGSPTAWWNNIYGTAVQAKYADLAEQYTADCDCPPGTVVVFGGSAEVTVSDESHTPYVAGVVSTQPAYLMNSDQSGVPLALSGRVPCRVQGPVKKGDRLVNIASGVAGKLDPIQYQPGCVIGHALENNETNDINLIEVVIMKF
jgi:hypothetical protein